MSSEEKTLVLPPMDGEGVEEPADRTQLLSEQGEPRAPESPREDTAPRVRATGLKRLTSGRICPLCRDRVDAIRCPHDGYLTVDARAESPENDLTGTVLGGMYLLEQRLVESTHNHIYAATQLSIDRLVAVKVRRKCDARHLRGIARFQREARILGGLDHPRIVRLIDMSVTPGGTFFMVLEHLHGEALSSLLKRTRLHPTHVLAIAIALADAMSAVHAADLVHRAIIPANVIVLRGRREVGAIKLIDFRLVKELAPAPAVADAPPVTRTGELVGDPRYLAPEQITEGVITPATDVYGLGLVVYEMLTGGRGPFEQPSSSVDAAVSHVMQKPELPTYDGRPMGGALVDLVMRMISKMPSGRPQDGAEALAALEEIERLKPQKQLWVK